MLGGIQPHMHDLLGRRIHPSTPGEILGDGVPARVNAVSSRCKPRHEISAAWGVRKLAARKISVDFERRDTIERWREPQGLNAHSSSRKRNEASHRSHLDGERRVALVAGRTGIPRGEQALDLCARARCARGGHRGNAEHQEADDENPSQGAHGEWGQLGQSHAGSVRKVNQARWTARAHAAPPLHATTTLSRAPRRRNGADAGNVEGLGERPGEARLSVERGAIVVPK